MEATAFFCRKNREINAELFKRQNASEGCLIGK